MFKEEQSTCTIFLNKRFSYKSNLIANCIIICLVLGLVLRYTVVYSIPSVNSLVPSSGSTHMTTWKDDQSAFTFISRK